MQFLVTQRPVPETSYSVFEYASVGAPVELALVPRPLLSRGLDVQRTVLLDNRRWSHDSVYLLLGPPRVPWQVYVGSTSDPMERLGQHSDAWPWWHRALLCSTPDLKLHESRQVERRVGASLGSHARTIVEPMWHRLPSERRDHVLPTGVTRTMLPAIENVLRTLGLDVTLEDD